MRSIQLFQFLDMEAESALFDGKLQGLIVLCHENERPLQGLAGVLDWRFHGQISKYIRSNAISGKSGECVYLPVQKNNRLYHIILLGGGQTTEPGKRDSVPQETFEKLKKNLLNLRLEKMGLSQKDFGNLSEELLIKNLKGVPLWITR